MKKYCLGQAVSLSLFLRFAVCKKRDGLGVVLNQETAQNVLNACGNILPRWLWTCERAFIVEEVEGDVQ